MSTTYTTNGLGGYTPAGTPSRAANDTIIIGGHITSVLYDTLRAGTVDNSGGCNLATVKYLFTILPTIIPPKDGAP